MVAFDLIQAVEYLWSSFTWVTWIAVYVCLCLVTRFVSGVQSRRTTPAQDGKKAQCPRTTPYWFPWLGHSVSILWNHLSLLEALRESAKESVFGVYLGGETFQVVASPSIMRNVFSSQETTRSPLVDKALRNVFGNRSSRHIARIVQQEELDLDVSSTIAHKLFISDASKSIEKILRREVQNFVSFGRSPVDQYQWERDAEVSTTEGNQSASETKLFALIRAFVGHNLTILLMSDAFFDNFPLFLTDLWTLDENFIPLFTGLRRWIPTTPKVSAAFPARDRLLHTLSVFHRAFNAFQDGFDPHDVTWWDLDNVSELFQTRMRTFHRLELPPSASASDQLSLFWDLIEYSAKLTFWMVAHISADSALLHDIRAEASETVRSSRRSQTGLPFPEPPQLEIEIEKMLESCQLLRACYYESVRLHTAGISLRKLKADMRVTESTEDAVQPRTYELHKGETVMMPHGLVNRDPQRFSNPDQFDPLRFIVTDEDSGLKRACAASLEPFSEGLHGSKHNAFTERAVLAFSASIVSMWDITAVDGMELRVPDNCETWGTLRPAKDVDVKIQLREELRR
ncbi:Uncharacterized protein PECH_004832 [Penicillium ucsense]|uniref:Cytochrome P450 n=1 Tax=Penicillium ucsense TaxID=2839758 RepID=A0A8J8WM35_9EURO|nr:Uncharacterized protein PECM_007532 [Penicillium ucsense]KAF7739347.1 Uncharacterized protein PECH_004832 [Penicillium ucsense]